MHSAMWALLVAASLQAAPAQDPPSEPWPDDQPFSRLVQNLQDDATALFTADNAIVFAAGSAVTLASHPADDNLASWIASQGTAGYTRSLDLLGDGWIQGGAAVGAYAFGRLAGRPQVTHIGSDLIRAQLLNGIITTVIKAAANRNRPGGGGHAFPSGHTSASFASAAVLERHYGWKVGVPAYAAAGLVGWSRIRDQKHWLSDIAMGATIGVVVGRAVTTGHRSRDWQIVPVRTDGGFALFVVRMH